MKKIAIVLLALLVVSGAAFAQVHFAPPGGR